MIKKATEAIIQDCNKIFSQTNGIEAVLEYLRKQGFSKPDSMIFLCEWHKVPGDKAKSLVHNSKAWAHLKTRDEKFESKIVNTFVFKRDA